MSGFKHIVDFMTHGSARPIRRLIGYYAILALIVIVLSYLFPAVARLLLGNNLDSVAAAPRLLPDGLSQRAVAGSLTGTITALSLLATTALALGGTLLLMLPVSWVYMSATRGGGSGHDQSVAQTLIILPIVVAGIVLVVRDSLALAFSLAGVVAGVRFRARTRDTRDLVFIFLAIAVGFAAGVQSLAVGAIVSVAFNVILLITWRYDFGRNVLEPTVTAQWTEPLSSLAVRNGNGKVPDRELILALSPSEVTTLAQRFERVRDVLGPGKKNPRYSAVLQVTTDRLGEAQMHVQKVLDKVTRRWRLDEIVTNVDKPSSIFYLLRLHKATTRDDVITALRARAGNLIIAANIEVSESFARSHGRNGA